METLPRSPAERAASRGPFHATAHHNVEALAQTGGPSGISARRDRIIGGRHRGALARRGEPAGRLPGADRDRAASRSAPPQPSARDPRPPRHAARPSGRGARGPRGRRDLRRSFEPARGDQPRRPPAAGGQGPVRSRPRSTCCSRARPAVFGPGLIAVILTGSGSDGSAGAWHVKKAGGAVVIENPATAMFPSMPSSIPPSLVDATADLDSIGSILCDLLAAGNPPAEGPDHDELRDLLERIHERSGIDFGSYKPATILRRLRGRMSATARPTLAEYAAYLESDPEEYARLVNSLLIKVTEFFRDPKLFDYLRGNVLPELIAEARRDRRELRIWSAGCSTGEEAYSLAIIVAEALGDELAVAGGPDLRDGHRPRRDRLRAPGDLSAGRPQGPARRHSRPLLREIGRRLRGRQTAARPDGLRRARPRRARALPADRSPPLPERADLLRARRCSGSPSRPSRSRCGPAAGWSSARPRPSWPCRSRSKRSTRACASTGGCPGATRSRRCDRRCSARVGVRSPSSTRPSEPRTATSGAWRSRRRRRTACSST